MRRCWVGRSSSAPLPPLGDLHCGRGDATLSRVLPRRGDVGTRSGGAARALRILTFPTMHPEVGRNTVPASMYRALQRSSDPYKFIAADPESPLVELGSTDGYWPD